MPRARVAYRGCGTTINLSGSHRGPMPYKATTIHRLNNTKANSCDVVDINTATTISILKKNFKSNSMIMILKGI
jgi:hypothetical protein